MTDEKHANWRYPVCDMIAFKSIKSAQNVLLNAAAHLLSNYNHECSCQFNSDPKPSNHMGIANKTLYFWPVILVPTLQEE